MITIVMSAVIGSERERVWRALTDPSERVGWDERIVARVDEVEDSPREDGDVRWRYRLGSVQLVMRERIGEVLPLERLEAALSLGAMRFYLAYMLRDEAEGAGRTHLGIKLRVRNSIPIMGDVIDRFEVRKMASEHIDSTLKWLQEWCETRP